MSRTDPKFSQRVCPKTGKPIAPARSWWRTWWLIWLYPIIGVVSLIWFVVRVAPKPSRATYPCQQLVAPLASSFVVWVIGVLGSILAFRKAKQMILRSRFLLATAALAIGTVSMYFVIIGAPQDQAEATVWEPRTAVKPANQPMGVPKGLNPGRVVWVHDADATDWNGTTDYWWNGGDTDQAVLDDMMAKTVRWLAGESTVADAWDELFFHFNQERGLQANAYQPGEKIAIKINLTLTNCSTYNTVDNAGNQLNSLSSNSVTVEMIHSLLDQLVNDAGVPEQDIFIGDPTCYFPTREYEYLSASFPDVNYMSARDGKVLAGRPRIQTSSVKLYWSTSAADETTQDYLPKYYADAKYFINLSILKAHSAAVTLCGKNHYGSLNRRPADRGYYNLHNSLPYLEPDMASYRALVDLMAHEHLGGKTILYLIDGIWGGYNWGGTVPQTWGMPPFNNDYPNSILASQDPVAIDSVGFDFYWEEDRVSWYSYPFTQSSAGREHFPHISGGDDYLHEAAKADNPPSGTFYDPEGDGTRIPVQGVHEHWNNGVDKQYRGNQGFSDGITLISSEPPEATGTVVGRYVFYNNSSFDGNDPAANADDDAAIATDKTALLAGQATAANYTSYLFGLNGVMVDIDGAPGPLGAADFDFMMGPGSYWIAAPTPTVSVRPGAGAGGSDRVTIVFPDWLTLNQWIKVTVKATVATGLAAADVFYFGNTPGDTCDSPTDTYVDAADVANCAANPRNFDLDDFVVLKSHFGLSGVTWAEGDYDGNGTVALDDFVILKSRFGEAALIDDPHDHNRDGRVDADDQGVCLMNPTNAANCLPLITVP